MRIKMPEDKIEKSIEENHSPKSIKEMVENIV